MPMVEGVVQNEILARRRIEADLARRQQLHSKDIQQLHGCPCAGHGRQRGDRSQAHAAP
jgi:hypothetical protein